MSQNPQLREGYRTKMSKSQWEMGLRTLNYERVIVSMTKLKSYTFSLRTLNYERAIVRKKKEMKDDDSLRTLNYERVIVR